MTAEQANRELEAIEWTLARRLFEAMEHLDPGGSHADTWDELRDRDRMFYRLSVQSLLEMDELVKRAIQLERKGS